MFMPNNTTDFAEQIKEGLDEVLGTDQKSLIMGLGVTDPKGVLELRWVYSISMDLEES
jgi:hypothetical protein